MYKIEYISTFYNDVAFIAEILSEYPQKAARIFQKIDKSLLNLIKMPEMYPVYHDVPSFRIIVIEDYLVFYKVKKRDKLVEIHRLFYGRMDIPAHLAE
jgi:plasmid stabilization system protein ParE